VSHGLDRVREVARKDKEARFTALLHHVDLDRLRAAYRALSPKAAPGVDGTRWADYGTDLEANLQDLFTRRHGGRYRAQPSRRAYIPKADGRQRPLGIATLEDKIVQRAVVEVLNAIYETECLGFSYGCRPGRNPHRALDALAAGILKKKVSWVLDADLRDFFTSFDHSWLMKFLERRIGDKRVLRLIQKWLRAGVIEEGSWSESPVGVPQGASVSPVLANVYLHYAFDQWAQQWRKRHARGDMIVVRYVDDFVVGFEHQSDAEHFLRDLGERLARFALELHPEKTRLIEFGRFAATTRAARGLGKPEAFDFLGFTHICGKTRAGHFKLQRTTISKRMRAKLHEVKTPTARVPASTHSRPGTVVGERAAWPFCLLRSARQHTRSQHFRFQVGRYWCRALRRRSQRHRLTWVRMYRLMARWLPQPRIRHPYPEVRFMATPEAGAQCVSSARWDLRGGLPERAVPTANMLRLHMNHQLLGLPSIANRMLSENRDRTLRAPGRPGRRLGRAPYGPASLALVLPRRRTTIPIAVPATT
jgi:group II intron reverse transcriptase/maturase